jgi:hypothetical protein
MALKVEFVPVETERDRHLFGMALATVKRLLVQTLCEMNGIPFDEVEYELVGDIWIDPAGNISAVVGY